MFNVFPGHGVFGSYTRTARAASCLRLHAADSQCSGRKTMKSTVQIYVSRNGGSPSDTISCATNDTQPANPHRKSQWRRHGGAEAERAGCVYIVVGEHAAG